MQKTLVTPQVQSSQGGGHACYHAPNVFFTVCSSLQWYGGTTGVQWLPLTGDSWIVMLVSVVASGFVYCRQRCGDDSANERTNDCTDGYLSWTSIRTKVLSSGKFAVQHDRGVTRHLRLDRRRFQRRADGRPLLLQFLAQLLLTRDFRSALGRSS